jgi:DNA primase
VITYLVRAAKVEVMRGSISDDFIEKLRADSDIVSIISDYVPLKKRGRNYWGCCPFHHEKTPSFSVTPEKGFFYCFGCQTGGNVFNFLMKIETIGFLDAVKLLAEKLNVPLPEQEKTEQELAREKKSAKLYRLNALARDFFHSCLMNTHYGAPARDYLLHRGVSEEMIKEFKLGFAPPLWDKLSTAFAGRGIKPEELVEAGLAALRNSGNGIYDRFRDRVIFPICDARGRVVGFGGRVLDNSQPKYLNSPETPVFNKRNTLFAFDAAYEAIRAAGRAIVVEGYMDAISAHAAGIKNVVASLGTAFTPEQARKILRCASEILFAYDSDAAGQNATLRALGIVQGLGAKIRVISIPGDKDPDEFIRHQGSEAFENLVNNACGFLEFQVNQALTGTDFSNLEGKVAVVAKIVPALASSDNAVEVNAHIARVSQKLEIDESAIRSEVKKFLTKRQKDKNVNDGENIRKLKVLHKPSAASETAERHLIRLLCEDHSLIPYVQAQLLPEEIRDDTRRDIIKFIFSAYNMGKNIIDAAAQAELSKTANDEFSHIMFIDMVYEDIAKSVDGCIRAIHLAHLQKLYEEHRLRADELERMGDSRFLQELAESQRIKHEISKLYVSQPTM